ncbi:hypothetical protein CY658_04830 [Variovorax sp. RO1]|uniref:hypothetical protein n=1 Tax=Variovorax sp. RO1 TaxID=2066034 RepID=UPI000C716FB7|nr:hypothetical protein [Variovorax sp. RO1]PLC06361.1 hypothetical protein CY658_04830 [Variovorax sp. RO1]
MSKHTINGFVTYEKSYGKPAIRFSMYRPNPQYSPHEVVVGEHSVEVEVPDEFDPIPLMVSALEEKKRLARVALAKELAQIDRQISELTCIEHTAEAA